MSGDGFLRSRALVTPSTVLKPYTAPTEDAALHPHGPIPVRRRPSPSFDLPGPAGQRTQRPFGHSAPAPLGCRRLPLHGPNPRRSSGRSRCRASTVYGSTLAPSRSRRVGDPALAGVGPFTPRELRPDSRRLRSSLGRTAVACEFPWIGALPVRGTS